MKLGIVLGALVWAAACADESVEPRGSAGAPAMGAAGSSQSPAVPEPKPAVVSPLPVAGGSVAGTAAVSGSAGSGAPAAAVGGKSGAGAAAVSGAAGMPAPMPAANGGSSAAGAAAMTPALPDLSQVLPPLSTPETRIPSPSNPAECPATAPEDPFGDCLGLPIYVECNYGTYTCVCDWYHWLCAG